MAWKFTSSEPIYMQIAGKIMTDIIIGRFSPGSRLPSVRELGMAAGVNPNTVQHAMVELERQGVVTALIGDGRYVTDNTTAIEAFKTRSASLAADEFIKRMQDLQIDRKRAQALMNEAFEKYEKKED